MPPVPRADPLSVVETKVAQGERLSAADGLALFRSSELLRIGRLADGVRRRKVGDDVYFVVNRHINYTNICRNRCHFCAFSRSDGEPGAYCLTVEEVLAKARESIGQGATEIHIVGGEHPTLPYADVRAMISGIREMAPTVHIKAFTASEIVHFAESEGVQPEQILRDLRERDRNDSSREHAPLRRADDAVVVDTTGLGVDAVVERLAGLAKERLPA